MIILLLLFQVTFLSYTKATISTFVFNETASGVITLSYNEALLIHLPKPCYVIYQFEIIASSNWSPAVEPPSTQSQYADPRFDFFLISESEVAVYKEASTGTSFVPYSLELNKAYVSGFDIHYKASSAIMPPIFLVLDNSASWQFQSPSATPLNETSSITVQYDFTIEYANDDTAKGLLALEKPCGNFWLEAIPKDIVWLEIPQGVHTLQVKLYESDLVPSPNVTFRVVNETVKNLWESNGIPADVTVHEFSEFEPDIGGNETLVNNTLGQSVFLIIYGENDAPVKFFYRLDNVGQNCGSISEGGQGQACRSADPPCNFGLVCTGGTCASCADGADGCACLPFRTCGPNLLCKWSQSDFSQKCEACTTQTTNCRCGESGQCSNNLSCFTQGAEDVCLTCNKGTLGCNCDAGACDAEKLEKCNTNTSRCVIDTEARLALLPSVAPTVAPSRSPTSSTTTTTTKATTFEIVTVGTGAPATTQPVSTIDGVEDVPAWMWIVGSLLFVGLIVTCILVALYLRHLRLEEKRERRERKMRHRFDDEKDAVSSSSEDSMDGGDGAKRTATIGAVRKAKKRDSDVQQTTTIAEPDGNSEDEVIIPVPISSSPTPLYDNTDESSSTTAAAGAPLVPPRADFLADTTTSFATDTSLPAIPLPTPLPTQPKNFDTDMIPSWQTQLAEDSIVQ